MIATVARPASAGLAALAAYSMLSIVLTWPLALGIGSDVPGDLGDSLLNMWILAWGAEHVPKLLTLQMSWADFWNANIFHPEPLSLALSEHLFGQTLQILPIYWLTGNIILCYNLLFISSFALSGFGTYLLVSDLTGDRRAAFIAGLIYGFLPYRIAAVPHLQVMSSQWMPFALWGLNRFVTAIPFPASRLPFPASRFPFLVLGTAALVMQNWSCGYYLLYFAPFVPLFVIHRMWTQGPSTSSGPPRSESRGGMLKDTRTWVSLAAAGIVTVVLSLPFLLPYQQAAERFGFQRPFAEVVLFSANMWSYITASENVTLWGQALRFYPHGEGETFLGFMPWMLAAIAFGGLLWRRSNEASANEASAGEASRFRRIVTTLLVVVVVTQLIAVLSVFLFGGFELGPISARTPQRLALQFVIAYALLLGISPAARRESLRLARSPIFFMLALTLLAVWLSLGPIPKAGDSLVSGFGLYRVFYDFVPGFNGVRVPARYAMIAGLFLAITAGFGARRFTSHLFPVAAIALLILVEGAAIPMEMNRTWSQNEATPPARVYPSGRVGRGNPGEGVPAVYQRVAALPAGTAITEFPFGDAAWEIRYVYYAAAHWKPITNGYSGNFPPGYKERVARLQRIAADPEAAWRSLKDSGTTHVIVHQRAFANGADAAAIEAWLTSHGAQEVQRFPEGDILLSIN